jgi:hypothetical protein
MVSLFQLDFYAFAAAKSVLVSVAYFKLAGEKISGIK